MTIKSFKVSSALKDIIGSQLITNDFIAVFELVKNAFDAHATTVDLKFLDLDGDNPRLIISDNGKGMDRDDLENKWLFVAYSAKKDGTEDYRDSISSNRIHAGAKGIGRFSCDKLGSRLKIYTKKKSKSSKTTNVLSIKWKDFEQDSTVEFEKIHVDFQETNSDPYGLKYGTILEISDLRETWDRDKLLTLRRSLEKLINPNQDNDAQNFSVSLTVPSEESLDARVDDYEPWNTVNGPVKNFLFESLGLKTTFINVKISPDGRTMTTRLEDRGTLIFEISEKNQSEYSGKKLKDVEVSLFALNRSAKVFFTRYMGLRVRDYGSVFLYKNGFRIHPYGEVGDDSLGIDSRKSQGTSRFLGTRDVVGRIEINGENVDFQEVTSRDGGLVRNSAYGALQHLFLEFCLKRLEKYAVDIVKYGNLGTDFHDAVKQEGSVRSKVLNLIQNLTRSDEILDFRFDDGVVDIFGELSEQSLQGVLANFKRIAAKSNNIQLEREATKVEKRLAELTKARQEAEAEAEEARKNQRLAEVAAQAEAAKAREAAEAADKARQESEQKSTQNLFLKSMISKDVSNVVSLHHHIGIAAGTIENYVTDITKTIASGKSYTTDQLLDVFDKISRQARKIATTTKFATKANFNLEATSTTMDICNYIQEYILNVCDGIIQRKDNKGPIQFTWKNDAEIEHVISCRPLEIAIILDNLINNSRKAGATVIEVSAFAVEDSRLQIVVSDDGHGIPKDNQGKIFDLGYTTTDGSGLGLSQSKSAMENMNGSLTLVSSSRNLGTQIELVFP
jgi:signal transduction histidine kinase